MGAGARATLPGTRCVLGVISYWLEHGSGVTDLLERPFWSTQSYRRSLANVNLVSFSIDHGDSYPGQLVAIGDAHDPRVYLVDNTIAFSDYENPKIPPAWDLSRLRVPALPRTSVERLLALSAAELGTLRAIERFELRSGQLLRKPPDRQLARRRANLFWAHGELSLGLTDAEIARVSRRIEELRELVRQGRVRTFD